MCYDSFVATFGRTCLRVSGTDGMYLSRRLVYQRKQRLERNLRIFQYLFRNAVHEVRIVVGEHAGYVQPLAVMLRGLVNTARQRLRQRVDSRYVVNVLPLDETRNPAPVVYQHFPTETLEEIQYSGVRFVFAEHLFGHCSRGVEMQGFRRMNPGNHIPQCMIRDSVDIDIRLWQTDRFACRTLSGQRSPVNEFRPNAFQLKCVIQVCAHAPGTDNNYFHY